MKNKLRQLSCLFMVALLLLSTACGKDNMDENNSGNNNGQEVQNPQNDGNGEEKDIPILYPIAPDEDSLSGQEEAFDEPETIDPDALEVTNPRTIVEVGTTYTGLADLKEISYYVSDPYNENGLSTEKVSHSFGVAKEGQPHSITVDNQNRFDSWKHNALAWDNKTEGKVLYLTFDCGYEYENLTGDILDTLKEKDVPAAFFCTLDYLEDAPEFVTRMINEGHIVGNHSTTHPSDSSALSREELAWELLGVHNYLRTNFGYRSHYFRFPTGTYSENAVELVDSVGYRSVFWSIAHSDWDPENQPGVDVSFDTVTGRLHSGAVILLHACSPDNAAILGDFIDYAEEQGYEFKSLDEYEYWDN